MIVLQATRLGIFFQCHFFSSYFDFSPFIYVCLLLIMCLLLSFLSASYILIHRKWFLIFVEVNFTRYRNYKISNFQEVTWKFSLKTCFKKIRKIHRKTPAIASFLVKLLVRPATLQKPTPLQVFYLWFYKHFQSSSLEFLWSAASVLQWIVFHQSLHVCLKIGSSGYTTVLWLKLITNMVIPLPS